MPAEPQPTAVELRGVTKTFGATVAVDGLDLEIRRGEVLGLIGPNGSGKTTTIRMILSILYPDDGRITVLGKTSANESKPRIGYLPEERGLYPSMKVGAFLAYLARLKGVPDEGMRARIAGWLDRVDLGHAIDTRCDRLSRGMKQRVQTLQALVHAPDLLILDEPFSGLDPVNRRRMSDLFTEEAARGCTLILSTHMMHHAEELCGHIVMMNRGRKVIDATLGEVRRLETGVLRCEPAGGYDKAALDAIPGVSTVRIEGQDLRIVLEPDAAPSAMIPKVTTVVPCVRIEVERASLEDVFLTAVGEQRP